MGNCCCSTKGVPWHGRNCPARRRQRRPGRSPSRRRRRLAQTKVADQPRTTRGGTRPWVGRRRPPGWLAPLQLATLACAAQATPAESEPEGDIPICEKMGTFLSVGDSRAEVCCINDL